MNQALAEILMPITVPASWIYAAAVGIRNRGFDRGRNVWKADLPVISVGNLTLGGVGKSPMVAWIADLLIRQGHAPVIAMRGYMARPGEMADEHAEYLDRLEEIKVVASPDRTGALKSFLSDNTQIDCILLDDGFQHRYIHRDLDLVLIDATRNTFRDRLLPQGRLREPLVNLQRADVVIITHAIATDDLISAHVERYHHRPPLAWANHLWSHLRVFESSVEEKHCEVNWIRGKGVVTLLGVGNPETIHTQLHEAGAKVLANIPAGDHERYDRAKINVVKGLCGGADILFMTAKDWVKARELIDLSSWPVPIVVPHLTMDVFSGAMELQEKILSTVESFAPHPSGKPDR